MTNERDTSLSLWQQLNSSSSVDACNIEMMWAQWFPKDKDFPLVFTFKTKEHGKLSFRFTSLQVEAFADGELDNQIANQMRFERKQAELPEWEKEVVVPVPEKGYWTRVEFDEAYLAAKAARDATRP